MTGTSHASRESKTFESSADETVTQARRVADDAIDSTARYAKGRTEEAEGIARDAVGKAASAAEAAKSFGADSVDFARRVVEQHPLASVGVATAIGFLIGSMLRR